MTNKYAHTVVLPPVVVAGQPLLFFCDLTRNTAIDELIANIETWLDLKAMPEAEQAAHIAQGVVDEDGWYALAGTRMHANRQSLQFPAFRQRSLERVRSEFFPKHPYPEVQAALDQLFPLKETVRETKTTCLH